MDCYHPRNPLRLSWPRNRLHTPKKQPCSQFRHSPPSKAMAFLSIHCPRVYSTETEFFHKRGTSNNGHLTENVLELNTQGFHDLDENVPKVVQSGISASISVNGRRIGNVRRSQVFEQNKCGNCVSDLALTEQKAVKELKANKVLVRIKPTGDHSTLFESSTQCGECLLSRNDDNIAAYDNEQLQLTNMYSKDLSPFTDTSETLHKLNSLPVKGILKSSSQSSHSSSSSNAEGKEHKLVTQCVGSDDSLGCKVSKKKVQFQEKVTRKTIVQTDTFLDDEDVFHDRYTIQKRFEIDKAVPLYVGEKKAKCLSFQGISRTVINAFENKEAFRFCEPSTHLVKEDKCEQVTNFRHYDTKGNHDQEPARPKESFVSWCPQGYSPSSCQETSHVNCEKMDKTPQNVFQVSNKIHIPPNYKGKVKSPLSSSTSQAAVFIQIDEPERRPNLFDVNWNLQNSSHSGMDSSTNFSLNASSKDTKSSKCDSKTSSIKKEKQRRSKLQQGPNPSPKEKTERILRWLEKVDGDRERLQGRILAIPRPALRTLPSICR